MYYHLGDNIAYKKKLCSDYYKNIILLSYASTSLFFFYKISFFNLSSFYIITSLSYIFSLWMHFIWFSQLSSSPSLFALNPNLYFIFILSTFLIIFSLNLSSFCILVIDLYFHRAMVVGAETQTTILVFFGDGFFVGFGSRRPSKIILKQDWFQPSPFFWFVLLICLIFGGFRYFPSIMLFGVTWHSCCC